MSPSPIRLLPPDVARLIAAGEVVSRPLDVVRELVDNALDAGATRIEIDLARGGLELVRVRDNGVGIAEADVPLAPKRHATSKLGRDVAPEVPAFDLNAIDTLGFRGEALWSVAQAGELTLVTRPAAQLGAVRLVARGEQVEVERVSAGAGTTVSVRDLFGALPARLRTQQPAATEVREVLSLVSRYVLHRPQLHWKVTVDGEARLTHAPTDERGAVAGLWGAVVANRVLTVETPLVRGVLSRPELSRPRRDRMLLSVNGRPVTFPAELERAVVAGYAELLPSGVSPVCVLDLRLPPADVNPNVHPAKTEVALADLPGLALSLTEAVRGALAAHPLARPAPELRVPAAGAQDVPAVNAGFPDLHFIGVYRDLYLLAEGEGDLWLIDTHAAAERVWYERFDAAFAEAASVELEYPELVRLTPEQAARLAERAPDFRTWGLVVEDFGADLARIRAIPAVLAGLPLTDLPDLLLGAALGSVQNARRSVLARLACAPALKAGSVTPERGGAVLTELRGCAQPFSCPHGRPTVMRLSERDLAHAFGRRSPRDLARGRDLTDLVAVTDDPR